MHICDENGCHMISLNDTAKMMTSDDYKERFKAEYYQLTIRIENLMEFLNRWEHTENHVHTRFVYESQMSVMQAYKSILEFRADVEDIKLL